MATLKAVNLAARFGLELCALAAIAYYPFHSGTARSSTPSASAARSPWR
jgi:hypothetical protein